MTGWFRRLAKALASRGEDDFTDLAEAAGVLVPDTAAALIALWHLQGDAPKDLIPDKEN